MRRSHRTISVDVDVDIDDVISGMDGEELADLARDAGYQVLATGDGDAARLNTTVERAFLAAKRMADVPREIADLFWHVHGRAL